MIRARRFAIVVALALGLLPLPAGARSDWRNDVAALLARRARAVEAGDERAFAATMAGAPAAFVERSRDWLRRLRALGLASYDLRLEPDGFGDLATALHASPQADEVHVVEVVQRTALRGYDAAPATETLFLTVARGGGEWAVVADDDLDDVGLESARNLWDFGAVRRLERGGAMVVFHPGRDPAANRLLRETLAGVGAVREAWPYRWDGRVLVMVPGTIPELERIFQSTFDLGPFVAFTSSSVEREGGWLLTGHRVFVQPDTFFDYPEATRRVFLDHELLHHATRAASGPFVPSWLDEGVAQLYGEQTAATTQVAARARAGRFDGRLPEDWEFTAGPRPDIHVAYDESLSFVAYLAGRFGRNAPARLYRTLGAVPSDALGTGRYHLDRAARRLFRATLATLELDWAADVRSRFR